MPPGLSDAGKVGEVSPEEDVVQAATVDGFMGGIDAPPTNDSDVVEDAYDNDNSPEGRMDGTGLDAAQSSRWNDLIDGLANDMSRMMDEKDRDELHSMAKQILDLQQSMRAEVKCFVINNNDNFPTAFKQMVGDSSSLTENALVDLFMAKLSYDAFGKWAISCEAAPSMAVSDLYESLSDAVQIAWRTAWSLHGSATASKCLSNRSGLLFFGYSHNSRKSKVSLGKFNSQFGTFEYLLKLMTDVVGKLLHESVPPSENVIKKFIDEINESKRHGEEEMKSTTSNSDRSTTQNDVYESVADEPTLESIEELAMDLNSSYHLDKDGRLAMTDRNGWRAVSNSRIFASMVTQHFHRLMHPLDGKPVPLDVLAGVTDKNEYRCMTDEGPTVEVHQQVFPMAHRDSRWYLMLPVFENHLSLEFLRVAELGLDQVPFGRYRTKYLRLASTWTGRDGKESLITFGNSNIQLYRGAKLSHPYEHGILSITNWVLAQLDAVMRQLLRILTEHFETRNNVGLPSSGVDSSTVDSSLDSSGEDDVFYFPVAKEGDDSLDKNDHLTILASSGNTSYTDHSDTHPRKGCIYDDEGEAYSHHTMMRICTTSIGRDSDGNSAERLVRSRNIGGLLTIGHLLPGSSSQQSRTHFRYLGYFSGANGTFHEAEHVKITVFSDVHLHVQLPFSQGKIHHEVEIKAKNKARVVVSARCTEPYCLTKERQIKVFGQNNLPKIANHCHDLENILATITKRGHLHSSSKRSTRLLPKFGHTDSTTEEGIDDVQENTPSEGTKDEFEQPHHRNGNLTEADVAKRSCVIGVSPSMRVEPLIASAEAAKAFAESNCSVSVTLDDGRQILTGPLLHPNSDSGKKLLVAGDYLGTEAIADLADLKLNRHNEEIFNFSRRDVLSLLKAGKNDPSVLRQLHKLLTDENAELETITIRSTGGAFTLSGSQQIDSWSENAVKDGPTHVCATSQDPNSRFSVAMMRACAEKRCISVFFKGYFLGLYQVCATHQKELSDEEVENKHKEMKRCIEELKKMDGNLFKDLDDNLENEMWSMAAMSVWIELKPVFPKSPTEHRKIRGWNFFPLTEKDYHWPSIHATKEQTKRFTAIGSDTSFTTAFKILQYDLHSFHFLEPNTRNRLVQEGKIKLPSESHGKDLLRITSTRCDTRSWDELWNLALHQSAVEHSKMMEEATVPSDNFGSNAPYTLPPRGPVGKEFIGTLLNDEEQNALYNKRQSKLRIKVLLIRRTHAPIIPLMPESAALWESTEELRRKHGTKWKHANGPDFSPAEECDAFVVTFLALVCCLQTPSSLMKNFASLEFFAPQPNSPQLGRYIRYLRSHSWGKDKFLHPIFKNLFQSTDEFVQFIEQFAKNGAGDIKLAIDAATTNGEIDRSKVVEELRLLLALKYNLTANNFQVHAILRTAETCTHMPYGDPNLSKVPLWWGSEHGANCFLQKYMEDLKADGNGKHCKKPKKELITEIPLAIVRNLNDWARRAHTRDDNSTCSEEEKVRIKLTLSVIGLEWCGRLNCIVHVYSNGKPFDTCDAEHMLCMYTTTLQHTLPSRNVSDNPNIDGPKCYPIRCTFLKVPVRSLKFMDPFRDRYKTVMVAYWTLTSDIHLQHTRLHNTLGIDFDEQDVDNPLIPTSEQVNLGPQSHQIVNDTVTNLGENQITCKKRKRVFSNNGEETMSEVLTDSENDKK